MGRSRGGFSSKLHALVDTQGRPIHIALTPGNMHDSMMAEELIAHARGHSLIADTGYDADRIVAAVRAKGMKPVIHCNPTRKRKRRLNRKLYRIRYHIELFIHRIKRFRAVATRYEKTARNYLALVQLVCAFVWLS